ncbi:hypothetical protein F5141DRAFT_1202625 [Pisolithus sp. B1]|nr:hypothetical protein F5141DRAFT_1202625 [Pisolithus sp. B1]
MSTFMEVCMAVGVGVGGDKRGVMFRNQRMRLSGTHRKSGCLRDRKTRRSSSPRCRAVQNTAVATTEAARHSRDPCASAYSLGALQVRLVPVIRITPLRWQIADPSRGHPKVARRPECWVECNPAQSSIARLRITTHDSARRAWTSCGPGGQRVLGSNTGVHQTYMTCIQKGKQEGKNEEYHDMTGVNLHTHVPKVLDALVTVPFFVGHELRQAQITHSLQPWVPADGVPHGLGFLLNPSKRGGGGGVEGRVIVFGGVDGAGYRRQTEYGKYVMDDAVLHAASGYRVFFRSYRIGKMAGVTDIPADEPRLGHRWTDWFSDGRPCGIMDVLDNDTPSPMIVLYVRRNRAQSSDHQTVMALNVNPREEESGTPLNFRARQGPVWLGVDCNASTCGNTEINISPSIRSTYFLVSICGTILNVSLSQAVKDVLLVVVLGVFRRHSVIAFEAGVWETTLPIVGLRNPGLLDSRRVILPGYRARDFNTLPGNAPELHNRYGLTLTTKGMTARDSRRERLKEENTTWSAGAPQQPLSQVLNDDGIVSC